ncbi:MAG: hypothetical protein MK081_13015 [Flavobacteriales bacterium]|nr:hypothetical protein [Flavobacteriales bacterium]
MNVRLLSHFIGLLFALMLTCDVSFGQTEGTSKVINFKKSDYEGGSQTREIAQLDNGYIVAANNDGLLLYDGVEWHLYRQPNGTIQRSIALDGSKVYCGGQNELGYWDFEQRSPEYISLIDQIPSNGRQFGEVWELQFQDGKLFARCENHFLIFNRNDQSCSINYKGERLVKSISGPLLHFRDSVAFDVINNNAFRTLPTDEGEFVDIVILQDGTEIIFTVGNGGTPLNDEDDARLTGLNDLLRRYFVNTIIEIKDGYLFTTRRGGVIITDFNLDITGQITVSEGLQRNDILASFLDSNDDVWLGTTNGIDVLNTSAPYHKLSPDGFLKGAGYACLNYKGDMYFGTNNGLFKAEPESFNQYSMVGDLVGQVWGLDVYDDILWISHQDGLFTYDGKILTHLYNGIGTWQVVKLGSNEDVLISGHYDGLGLIQKQQDTWKFIDRITGIDQSARIMAEEDESTWWVSHPYIGAWRVEFNDLLHPNVQFYDQENGFPSNQKIYVERVGDNLIFTSEEGLYTYDTDKDTVKPLKGIEEHFPTTPSFRRVFNGPKEDMWFITETEFGIMNITESAIDKTVSVAAIPELKQKLVNGFESTEFINDSVAYIGAEDGFISIDLNDLSRYLEKTPSLTLRTVESLNNDTIYYSTLNQNENVLELNKAEASFRIRFRSTSFIQERAISVQTRLEGFEDEWTVDDGSYFRDYTNLPANDYTFVARIVDGNGTVLSSTSFNIEVQSAWYSSTIAVFSWITLGAVILVLVYLSNERKYKKEKAALVIEKEKELQEQKNQSVQVIDQIRSEQLESEIAHKNKELASATMHLVQKGKLLQGIKDGLQGIKIDDGEKASKEIRRLIKVINSDMKLDNNWDQFELHFDQVHVDFLKRLRDQFPQLTPNDHKLCAYLRMNLTTKEIATIMNISVRGVEISRYRLRKKLGIDKEVNLTEFILNV